MHIGIDASRAALPQRTGTENYSLHLIRALLSTDTVREHRFTLYFNRAPTSGLFLEAPKCTIKIMPFARLWTHGRLSLEMARHPPNVLFVPAHVLPIWRPHRSLVTIHDLGYLYFPEAYPTYDQLYLRLSTWYSAHYATHLLADSQATKEDLFRHLGIPDDKVTVVYPAPGPEFRLIKARDTIAAVVNRYGIQGDYLLYVGTVQPRKNLLRLLEAYTGLRQAGKIEAKLVVAGRLGWLSEGIAQRLRESGDDVILAGFVPSQDLPALMSGAMAFVMPSLFEGFGLPTLEAMACGTPVIASRAGSLPEVVGDAGLLVNPLDVKDIAGSLERIVSEPELRAELRERGLARAAHFTWERAAASTLTVLEQIAG